jgi:prepilin-type N-terminal cleavage/methylation domain-containing protein
VRAGRSILARRRARRGLTLVEVMAAIVVLSVAVSGLAGMTVWAGRRAAISAMQQGRLAVTAQLVDQFTVLPFDSLPAAAGCSTVDERPFPHTHCVSVLDVSATRRLVSIVIRPASALLRADSLTFERAATPPASPVS